MTKFVLIGGKSKDSNINLIEEEIIKLSKKDNPTILFCPYASNNIEKACENFKKLINNLKCNIIYLNYDNILDFESLLKKSDILYISGGISDKLVDIFLKYKLDLVLKKYINEDKIYAGSSAGAMLYTKISLGDKDMFVDNFHNYNYKMVNCLNILNISICPHYQNEDLIIYNDIIKKYKLDSFGIEEDCALVIDNDNIYCIKDNKKRSIYYFKYVNDKYELIDMKEGVIYENCNFGS